MYMTDKLTKKLSEGKTLLGSHIFCGTPMLTEAIAQSGFDMLWIDMEHTAITEAGVLENLIAARAGGCASFVRIPWNDPVRAKPVIDMGPDAIIFPYIRSVEDAKLAVASCEYPPRGIRGYGPLRALDYGAIAQTDFVDTVYRSMWRVIQIEHVDAVECLEELAELDGIDAFIVGPNDLSGSLGHIGRVSHPDMMPYYDRIGEVLTRKNRPFGVSMGFEATVLRQWIDRGAKLLFCGNDVGYIRQGAVDTLGGMRSLI